MPRVANAEHKAGAVTWLCLDEEESKDLKLLLFHWTLTVHLSTEVY